MKSAALLALPLAFAASACLRDDSQTPSLAMRPQEKLGFGEPEVTPAVAVPDPALDAQAAAVGARLATIRAGFDRAAGAAARAAGRPGARTVGSEPWLEAQSALAETDDWRAQANALASEIDALSGARATALQPPYPALAEAAGAIRTESERQAAEADLLAALLPAG